MQLVSASPSDVRSPKHRPPADVASRAHKQRSELAAQSAGDRDLVDLQKQLAAAWQREREIDSRSGGRAAAARENDRIYEAAHRVSRGIVDRMLALRATTLEGLRAKGYALSWTHNGETFGSDRDPTTDVRLVDSIMCDLLAK